MTNPACPCDAYRTILDAYRDADRDLSAIVEELPGDRLNRLGEACRRLGRLVEVETIRRHGVPLAAG
jgi:hypothetical protein